MREIKFRGFDEENNCWRYGWYTRLVEGARAFDAIICFEDDGVLTRYYIHDDATIGQFTGLLDRNGVEIYEDDKVSDGENIIIVAWDDKFASFALLKRGWMYKHFFSEAVDAKDCEVIGNIHEGATPCTSAIVE